ncbi:hypothetical protein [Polaribacter sp. IC073]|uniref:hypothetical protein n=1 Tax=Polaribacter sp. IC073 TaxID=2508540 RepID=UPI0011BDC558|nr:hypothetical protein [Polaribacter sp. IC073]TXD48376.1 hypothetical protein ES045_08090 [Polaribacter sp. IC073]
MKSLKTVIAVIAISLSIVFSVSASETNPKKAKKTKTLRTELSSFIGNDIPFEINKTITAEVSFIINNNNEVVVLSIKSKVSELNSFLKRRLNCKRN